MRYVIACACGQQIEVTSVMAGSEVRCKACQQFVDVPSLQTLRNEHAGVEEAKPATGLSSRARAWLLLFGVLLVLAVFLLAGLPNWAVFISFFVILLAHAWLIMQIGGQTSGGMAILAFFVPLVGWVYAIQRWDIAFAPILLKVIGIVAMCIGFALMQ